MGRWARKPVNHTSWMALVTSTDRPKSVRNRCLIELFCGVVCVVTLPFWHFFWCRGFCHRTESDLFLFLLATSEMPNHISTSFCCWWGWLIIWWFLSILGHRIKGQGQVWHYVSKTVWAWFRKQFFLIISKIVCWCLQNECLIFRVAGRLAQSPLFK